MKSTIPPYLTILIILNLLISSLNLFISLHNHQLDQQPQQSQQPHQIAQSQKPLPQKPKSCPYQIDITENDQLSDLWKTYENLKVEDTCKEKLPKYLQEFSNRLSTSSEKCSEILQYNRQLPEDDQIEEINCSIINDEKLTNELNQANESIKSLICKKVNLHFNSKIDTFTNKVNPNDEDLKTLLDDIQKSSYDICNKDKDSEVFEKKKKIEKTIFDKLSLKNLTEYLKSSWLCSQPNKPNQNMNICK